MNNSPAKPNICLYTGGDPTSSTIQQLFAEIQAAKYTTAVLWAAHVQADGSINMNDDPVAVGGKLAPNLQTWVECVNSLRTGTVNYIELSLGGDQTSFANIKSLIQEFGIGPANPLYGNLQALQIALKLDAVDFDDETEYDKDSSLELASMCIDLGMAISICPYTNQQYWVDLVTNIDLANPGAVVAAYLQCYDGGFGNDPAQWDRQFKKVGIDVTPGLWAKNSSPSEVQTQFAAWVAKRVALAGGFMYVGTLMLNPGGPSPADYSAAIIDGLKGVSSDMPIDPGYDPSGDLDVVHERIEPTGTAPSKHRIPSNMLPPVGMQGTSEKLGAPGSCVAWASVYGLATAAAARAGGYDPSSQDLQASPASIYIEVIDISEPPCVGSSAMPYFKILASSGTPNLANAPYYPDCTTLINDYHNPQNPPANDMNFQLTTLPTTVSANDAASIKEALVQNRPLAYGTRLYTDFSKYDGKPVPYVGNGIVIVNKGKPAGHCMMIIGYDDTMPYTDRSGQKKEGAYLIQNSFGAAWGADGYFWVAYETFLDLAQGTCFVYQ